MQIVLVTLGLILSCNLSTLALIVLVTLGLTLYCNLSAFVLIVLVTLGLTRCCNLGKFALIDGCDHLTQMTPQRQVLKTEWTLGSLSRPLWPRVLRFIL